MVYKNRGGGGGGIALISVYFSAVSFISGNISGSYFFIEAGNEFKLSESVWVGA